MKQNAKRKAAKAKARELVVGWRLEYRPGKADVTPIAFGLELASLRFRWEAMGALIHSRSEAAFARRTQAVLRRANRRNSRLLAQLAACRRARRK